MKVLLIVQLLVLMIKPDAANIAGRGVTFNDYFSMHKKPILEKELRELENYTMNHPDMLGIDPNQTDYMPLFYYISKIAVSVLKDLTPPITLKDAEIIGDRFYWILQLGNYFPYPGGDSPNLWDYIFEIDDTRPEPVGVKKWRNLTNRILAWKYRRMSWQFAPNKAGEYIGIRQINSAKLFADDEQNFLKKEYHNLTTRCFNFSGDHLWMSTVFNASTISRNTLNELLPDISADEAFKIIRYLPWDLVPNDDHQTVCYSDLWYCHFRDQWDPPSVVSHKQWGRGAADLLHEWMVLTNRVIDWKLRSLLNNMPPEGYKHFKKDDVNDV